VVWCIINYRFYTVCSADAVENRRRTTYTKRSKKTLQNLLSVYLMQQKEIERDEIEKFQDVYSDKDAVCDALRAIERCTLYW
jgi:hypothetical protein